MTVKRFPETCPICEGPLTFSDKGSGFGVRCANQKESHFGAWNVSWIKNDDRLCFCGGPLGWKDELFVIDDLERKLKLGAFE